MTENEIETIATGLENELLQAKRKYISIHLNDTRRLARYVATLIEKEKADLLKDAIELAEAFPLTKLGVKFHIVNNFLAKYQKEK